MPPVDATNLGQPTGRLRSDALVTQLLHLLEACALILAVGLLMVRLFLRRPR